MIIVMINDSCVVLYEDNLKGGVRPRDGPDVDGEIEHLLTADLWFAPTHVR